MHFTGPRVAKSAPPGDSARSLFGGKRCCGKIAFMEGGPRDFELAVLNC